MVRRIQVISRTDILTTHPQKSPFAHHILKIRFYTLIYIIAVKLCLFVRRVLSMEASRVGLCISYSFLMGKFTNISLGNIFLLGMGVSPTLHLGHSFLRYLSNQVKQQVGQDFLIGLFGLPPAQSQENEPFCFLKDGILRLN